MRDRSPVFVVGAQRSGTSWVQRLLAAHPKIVSGQESHLFSAYLAPLWQRWQTESELRQGGRRIGLACYLTEQELLEELRRLAQRVFVRLEKTKPGAELLVEKTPDHGLHLPLIGRLFPDAAIVHVLRDGRDVAASLRDASRQRWGQPWAPPTIAEAIVRWRDWVTTIRRDLAGFARTYTVRYEDLVADGPTVLAQLYRFVGTPLPPHQVKTIFNRCRLESWGQGGPDSLMLAGEQRGAVCTEPEGFFRRGQPSGWKTDLSRMEQVVAHTLAGSLLDELSYEPTPLPADRGEPDPFVSSAGSDDLLWKEPARLDILRSARTHLVMRERLYLYAAILALAPERCLEIASGEGGAAQVFHAALEDLGRGQLVALAPTTAAAAPPDLLSPRVTFLTGCSPAALRAAEQLAGAPFDFVLVDADLSTEGVRASLEGLVGVTRPGALVLVHDAYVPSVAEAIEAVLKAAVGYSDVGLVCTTPHRGWIGGRDVVYCGFRLLVRTPATAADKKAA